LTGTGADGGVDVRIYAPTESSRLFAVAQCKAWTSDPVGVAIARELWGVLHHEKASLGLIYGLSGFTPDAVAFASGKHLKLVSGEDLLAQIGSLMPESQTTLLASVCRDDYWTPSCPSCDRKLIARARGSDGESFWGCVNYPRCHYRMPMSKSAKARLDAGVAVAA
jgi:restriction system protein